MGEGLDNILNKKTNFEDDRGIALTPANSQNNDTLREHYGRFDKYEAREDLTQEELEDIQSLIRRLESSEEVPVPTSWDEYQIDTRGFTDAEALEFPMPKFFREVLYPASVGALEENESDDILSDLENIILQKLSSNPDAFTRELRHFFTKSPELRTVSRKALFLSWLETLYSQAHSWETYLSSTGEDDGTLEQRSPEKFKYITLGTEMLERSLNELSTEEDIDGFSKMRLIRLVHRVSSTDERLRSIDYETEVDEERPFEIAPGKLGAVVKGRVLIADSTLELQKEYQDWCDLYEQYQDYSDLDDQAQVVSFDDLMTRLDLIHKKNGAIAILRYKT